MSPAEGLKGSRTVSRHGLEVWRIDGDPAPLARDNIYVGAHHQIVEAVPAGFLVGFVRACMENLVLTRTSLISVTNLF